MALKASIAVGTVATLLNGVICGSMFWVSTVTVPTLMDIASRQEDRLTLTVFQAWWPKGRRVMTRLIPITVVANLAASACYRPDRQSRISCNWMNWIGSAMYVASIGLWTVVKMIEGTVTTLAEADPEKEEHEVTDDDEEISHVVERFCQLHHPRLAFAAGAFGLSLYTILASLLTDEWLDLVSKKR
eukprot:scaffold71659_cov57-Attheya_sp.AAC.5